MHEGQEEFEKYCLNKLGDIKHAAGVLRSGEKELWAYPLNKENFKKVIDVFPPTNKTFKKEIKRCSIKVKSSYSINLYNSKYCNGVFIEFVNNDIKIYVLVEEKEMSDFLVKTEDGMIDFKTQESSISFFRGTRTILDEKEIEKIITHLTS